MALLTLVPTSPLSNTKSIDTSKTLIKYWLTFCYPRLHFFDSLFICNIFSNLHPFLFVSLTVSGQAGGRYVYVHTCTLMLWQASPRFSKLKYITMYKSRCHLEHFLQNLILAFWNFIKTFINHAFYIVITIFIYTSGI